MTSSARLRNKTVLITGGASGLGAAQARLFVAEGASVVIGDVAVEKGEALAAELGDSAVFAPLDVRDHDQWVAVVATASDTFGQVDGLVNNAGILLMHSVESATETDYRRVIDINQVGTFLGMQAVVPALRAAGGGSIVNMSSIAGLSGAPGLISYVASKWAVRGMSKAAARELAAHGIRVNSVHPGSIATPMVSEQDGAAIAESVPLGRQGDPLDVAKLALFLLSDDSSYVTGSEYVVDGGSSA